ncbi:MAG: 4-alpha-glucanotransferase [Solirubrobacteraceae bacterium]|nr:4-alpha-glucanotransferase [Solirubrobacteraceae bacterium]
MRESGIQLHPTSLPSGRLGPDAYAFVDWLAAAGQSVWQVLPLGPPDRHGSPYKSASAFACSAALLADPGAPVSAAEIADFRARNAYWAGSWPDLADQVRFAREWSALRTYAASAGVKLMGDVPIYVAPGGADQREWPQYFRDDAVAGVPPDDYAPTGQLWGNPLYDWDALAADGYRWWTERFRRTFDLFDLVRVDHFRGFAAYWAVPAGEADALRGSWEPGPGAAVFEAAAAELGELAVVAEDLGDITPDVVELRRSLGFPGMAVLQFAFHAELGVHDPQNHVEHQVVYTGTHDSDTVVGWWAELEATRRANAQAAFDGPADEPVNWAMIRLAWASPARLAMTQAQDVLGLGSEARMNVPGTKGSSWRWRLEPGALTAEHARRLRELTDAAQRS